MTHEADDESGLRVRRTFDRIQLDRNISNQRFKRMFVCDEG